METTDTGSEEGGRKRKRRGDPEVESSGEPDKIAQRNDNGPEISTREPEDGFDYVVWALGELGKTLKYVPVCDFVAKKSSTEKTFRLKNKFGDTLIVPMGIPDDPGGEPCSDPTPRLVFSLFLDRDDYNAVPSRLWEEIYIESSLREDFLRECVDGESLEKDDEENREEEEEEMEEEEEDAEVDEVEDGKEEIVLFVDNHNVLIDVYSKRFIEDLSVSFVRSGEEINFVTHVRILEIEKYDTTTCEEKINCVKTAVRVIEENKKILSVAARMVSLSLAEEEEEAKGENETVAETEG